MSGYKTPTNKMSNNKTSKITHHPKTKRPNNDNKDEKAQIYKMFNVTKCQKLQNVQNYKMSKVTRCPKLQHAQR